MPVPHNSQLVLHSLIHGQFNCYFQHTIIKYLLFHQKNKLPFQYHIRSRLAWCQLLLKSPKITGNRDLVLLCCIYNHFHSFYTLIKSKSQSYKTHLTPVKHTQTQFSQSSINLQSCKEINANFIFTMVFCFNVKLLFIVLVQLQRYCYLLKD